jgi:ABC-type bacteriocin/lantibiotic exporter with double-glycine peptidase domain
MKKFENRIWEANQESIDLTKYNSRLWLVGDVTSDIMEFGFYLLGVILVKNNLLLASNFLVLYMYKKNIRYWFSYLTQLVDVIKSFNFSANRVFEIIDGNTFSKEQLYPCL